MKNPYLDIKWFYYTEIEKRLFSKPINLTSYLFYRSTIILLRGIYRYNQFCWAVRTLWYRDGSLKPEETWIKKSIKILTKSFVVEIRTYNQCVEQYLWIDVARKKKRKDK